MSKSEKYQKTLKDANLRVTPQRIAVLDAIYNCPKHPSAEEIASFVKKNHPSIAFGTIYNVLDSMVGAGILTRVKTDKGAMLYDHITEKHHHLYCSDSDKIEDYHDKELDKLLEDYFRNHAIEGFSIEDIKLQLVGNFKKNK